MYPTRFVSLTLDSPGGAIRANVPSACLIKAHDCKHSCNVVIADTCSELGCQCERSVREEEIKALYNNGNGVEMPK